MLYVYMIWILYPVMTSHIVTLMLSIVQETFSFTINQSIIFLWSLLFAYRKYLGNIHLCLKMVIIDTLCPAIF